jgi:hypothetical protein
MSDWNNTFTYCFVKGCKYCYCKSDCIWKELFIYTEEKLQQYIYE